MFNIYRLLSITIFAMLLVGCATNSTKQAPPPKQVTVNESTPSYQVSMIRKSIQQADDQPLGLLVPIKAANGNVVPVKVTLSEPLKKGDQLYIYTNAAKNLAYTITTTGDSKLYSFSGRLRTSDGHVTATLINEKGKFSIEKTVEVEEPANIPAMGNTDYHLKCRAKRNVVKCIFRNKMAVSNHLNSATFSSAQGDVKISMTPYVTGRSYDNNLGYLGFVTGDYLKTLEVQLR